jgi:hypothetical protein
MVVKLFGLSEAVLDDMKTKGEGVWPNFKLRNMVRVANTDTMACVPEGLTDERKAFFDGLKWLFYQREKDCIRSLTMGDDWETRTELGDLWRHFYHVVASKLFGRALRPPAVGIEIFDELLRTVKKTDTTWVLDKSPGNLFRFTTNAAAEEWAIRALPVVVQPPRTHPKDLSKALQLVTAANMDAMDLTAAEMAASTMISPYLLASIDVMMWSAIRGGSMSKIDNLEDLEAARVIWWSEEEQLVRLDKFLVKQFGKKED